MTSHLLLKPIAAVLILAGAVLLALAVIYTVIIGTFVIPS